MTVILLGVLGLSASVYLLWQVFNGLKHGSIWFNVGEDDSAACHRNSEPLLFWLMMTGHAVMAVVIFSVVFGLIVNRYLWGEAAPTITDVQPNYTGKGVEVYWKAPDRLIHPDKYVVHRRNVFSGEVEQVGSVEGVEFRFGDEGAQEEASYVYRVEACYSGLAAWFIGEEGTVSKPAASDLLGKAYAEEPW